MSKIKDNIQKEIDRMKSPTVEPASMNWAAGRDGYVSCLEYFNEKNYGFYYEWTKGMKDAVEFIEEQLEICKEK